MPNNWNMYKTNCSGYITHKYDTKNCIDSTFYSISKKIVTFKQLFLPLNFRFMPTALHISMI